MKNIREPHALTMEPMPGEPDRRRQSQVDNITRRGYRVQRRDRTKRNIESCGRDDGSYTIAAGLLQNSSTCCKDQTARNNACSTGTCTDREKHLSLSIKVQQNTHTVPGAGAGVGEWVCVCVKTKMLEVISDIDAR